MIRYCNSYCDASLTNFFAAPAIIDWLVWLYHDACARARNLDVWSKPQRNSTSNPGLQVGWLLVYYGLLWFYYVLFWFIMDCYDLWMFMISYGLSWFLSWFIIVYWCLRVDWQLLCWKLPMNSSHAQVRTRWGLHAWCPGATEGVLTPGVDAKFIIDVNIPWEC